MGGTLLELEQLLRSSKDKLSRQEEDFLQKCKVKALQNFTISACLASGVVWKATKVLDYGGRIILSGGAAALCGFWMFNNSMNSSVTQIMKLKGSRMQQELSNLLLVKRLDDPQNMYPHKRHIYAEKVFEDSNFDHPILRWRYRNFFTDNVGQSRGMHNNETYTDNVDPSQGTHKNETYTDNVDQSQGTHKNETYVDKTDSEPKQFTVKPAIEIMADPFDCIFGYPGSDEEFHHEEIHHPDTTVTPPKRRSRRYRRVHRHYYRIRNQEISSLDNIKAEVE